MKGSAATSSTPELLDILQQERTIVLDNLEQIRKEFELMHQRFLGLEDVIQAHQGHKPIRNTRTRSALAPLTPSRSTSEELARRVEGMHARRQAATMFRNQIPAHDSNSNSGVKLFESGWSLLQGGLA